MAVERMRHHGPGWTLETGESSYWLWAPQDGTIPDPYASGWSSENPRRKHWAACWQENVPEDAEEDYLSDGEFRKADSMEEALGIFPVAVRERFEAAVREAKGVTA